ncbi:MAG: hypothetical protein HY520_02090 [Candidatus Aenigmarchaeota archaeon]|nr:hypothetical protein [Candidatus Aenigmarchaeota archaeon]
MVERIATGVAGLDSKLQGGFFKTSVNLVTGKTGTGKSAFCASFLYAGVQKKEPGFYLTTEEREEDIKADIESMFGWDLAALEQRKLLKFLSIKPVFPGKRISTDEMNRLIKLYVYDIAEKLDQGIRAVKARRVVIDSVSLIEMFIKDEYLSRTVLMHLVEKLKNMGVTAIFTGTVPETSEGLSGGGIIEYLVDGVIKLDFVPVAEEFKRTLTIRKMRRTDHSVLIHPFDIGKAGLRLVEIK